MPTIGETGIANSLYHNELTEDDIFFCGACKQHSRQSYKNVFYQFIVTFM
jgi:hypothetical protein